ncbi:MULTISPECIES: S24 family peptidase [unclassified Sphingomonas]|uniref:S24 family peptidase n=1 Tax=unclassified Sphingomonas TaxID=196159 RepID=UPI001620D5D5|nr:MULTISPECIES: S24 family peptidase [unclassified Sphingomonas]MBB3348663.1 SOS-response transcriptional repressor LexA [Sphingomonas sp. BK069]MBB3474239.1 SOS-response transcriptional repressor LexA [Sphingomonas sp. BK345]
MAETPQQALTRAAAERGVALSALSRMIGRNQAYLSQFVLRGSPRRLPERERRLLADFLALDEAVLGAAPREEDVAVPWLAVRAAAGHGRVAEERLLRAEPVPRALLRAAGIAPAAASLITVAGESMAPTLRDGDRLLVDTADRRPAAGGAIYVIRRDEELAVKRLVPEGATVAVHSDNPDWPTSRVAARALVVIGRARLLTRML